MVICTKHTVFIRFASIACCASLTMYQCVMYVCTLDRDCDRDRDHCYCHFCCVLNVRKLCSKLAFVSLANFVKTLGKKKKR